LKVGADAPVGPNIDMFGLPALPELGQGGSPKISFRMLVEV
jgi:hypothetical protein